MVDQIIVPLDRSHIAECAVPYARALAKRTGAPIVLLSVIEEGESLPEPPPEEDRPPMEIPPNPGDPLPRRYEPSMPIGFNPHTAGLSESEFEEITSLAAEAEEYLDYVANSISEAKVEKRVMYGDPITRLIEVSSPVRSGSARSPIIVMASHGRSGLGRALLGSVTLKAAERIECPMMVIRAISGPVPSVDQISLNRAFIALDGSDFSQQVIEPLRTLLGHQNTSFHLLRVVESGDRWAGQRESQHILRAVEGEDSWASRQESEDTDRRTPRQRAEEYLTTIEDEFSRRGYEVTWDVVDGDPARRINEIANDVDADLIGLATHGYSGLKRLAIGSVAEEVLHKATRPLFLVRPPDSGNE